MKKIALFLSLLASQAYAVDDSIKIIQDYNNKYLITPQEIVKEDTLKRDIKVGQKTQSMNFLLDNLNEEVLSLVADNPLYKSRVKSDKFTQEDSTLISQLQAYFSLNPTGILDPQTYNVLIKKSANWQKAALAQSLEELGIVRQKQLSAQTPKYIVINIPNMTAYAYEYDTNTQQSTLYASSKVVVGKTNTKTPLQDFSIWGIKYNPNWTPTPNMIKRSVIKSDGFNTAWLKSHGITVTDSTGQKVNYSDMVVGQKYTYRQASGDNNALGLLKFETDSPENIYLHDTNERHLFKNNMRLNSSGCIRVQNYMDFAKFISNYSTDEIQAKIDTDKTKIEKTDIKIPVYFTYALAMPIEQEIPAFYLDVYNRTKFYN